MKETAFVDVEVLRDEVRRHYAEVATHPDGEFHFLTGRSAARQVGYAETLLEGLPDAAVEAFAGSGGAAVWDVRVSDKVVSRITRQAHPPRTQPV